MPRGWVDWPPLTSTVWSPNRHCGSTCSSPRPVAAAKHRPLEFHAGASAGPASHEPSAHPPRLTLEDTVLDLVGDPDCGDREAVNWLTMAVNSRRTTPQRILRAAQVRHFLRQRALISAVLDDVAAGRPQPARGRLPTTGGAGSRTPDRRRQASRRGTEVDVLYEDSGCWSSSTAGWVTPAWAVFGDMRRDNAATSDGLATLRYGKADVFGIPCAVADEVARTPDAPRLGRPRTPLRPLPKRRLTTCAWTSVGSRAEIHAQSRLSPRRWRPARNPR